jgi:DNA-binding NarL/FixJ family response regulator
VLKDIRGGDLVGAVRTVAAGGSLLDARSTAHVLARLRDEGRTTRSTCSPSRSAGSSTSSARG